MNNKNLQDWLKHIESFHPAEIELGLDRIRSVADKLDLLTPSAKVILVAGTNGKGSCVSMLESIALTKGKSVATYTSPHLLWFNERIRINGKNIDDESLIRAFSQIENARGEVALTFFEFTTLAALHVFKQSLLELIVLEVGLGGRQDATNIIEPDVCIITTVDRDHSDWLGDELESIAYEKGGILRSHKPGLVGDQRTLKLLKKVLPEFSSELQITCAASKLLRKSINEDGTNTYQLLEQNITLAQSAFNLAFNASLNDTEVTNALAKVEISGRFQKLSINLGECYGNPNAFDGAADIIFDVAHNPQSAQNLGDQLMRYKKTNRVKNIIAVCGMMADKAIAEVLSCLEGVVDSWCFDLDMSRAIKARQLKELFEQQQALNNKSAAHSQCFVSVDDAMTWISNEQKGGFENNETLILVFGSFITVANMLQYVNNLAACSASSSADNL